MARYRGKKALYEVIGRHRSQAAGSRPQEQQNAGNQQGSGGRKDHGISSFKRPKLFYTGSGRLELSVPYPIVVMFVLGLILALLISFRLGKATITEEMATAETGIETTQRVETPVRRDDSGSGAVAKKPERVESTGDNRIVIQSWAQKRDLEPLEQFFDQRGIATEIKRVGNRYFLVTQAGFAGNPDRAGTEGYRLKQKIIEIGADYRAPAGYGAFGPFNDAYGMKF